VIQTSIRSRVAETVFLSEQKDKIDKFKQDLDYAKKNVARTYYGALGPAEGSPKIVHYQIIPKFYIRPWKENEKNWTWPPHITVLRATPGQFNYQYVNDIILFTDEEHVKIRKNYGSRGFYDYVYLLENGTVWKFDPFNLSREVYKVRFNGKKFELYKIVD
jgi:hypothetical protein